MRWSFLRRRRVRILVLAVVVTAAIVYGWRRIEYYSADPAGDKNCTPAPRPADATADAGQPRAIRPLSTVQWKQIGGTIDDASCLDRTDIYGVVDVRTLEDISRTLAFARTNGLKVSVAGVRHSMGGQAFRKGAVVLDMTRFNRIALNQSSHSVTVQAGATWHAIQLALHPKYAVRAMQSTDIFTVGGSISVNAHGMDHQAGALARSIRSMRVMLADGSVLTVSPTEHGDLFNLVVGGYGLFGVILDAELDIADNAIYEPGRRIIDYREFPAVFANEIEGNSDIALMYAHLSTAPSSFLREALIYSYARTDEEGAERHALDEVSSIRLRRLVFNLSKLGGPFMELKWFSEKYIERHLESCTVTRAQAIRSGEACFVTRNDPMHDSVPYLRNNMQNDTDILHEYFIPRDQLIPFIDGMRDIFTANNTNLLNASIRVVHKEENTLTYAPAPAFSVVLYINQTADEAGNRAMEKVTRELIELTLRHNGRFFLPYQLYYDAATLKRSYPQIGSFFASKREYDPDELLSNTFYQRYGRAAL